MKFTDEQIYEFRTEFETARVKSGYNINAGIRAVAEAVAAMSDAKIAELQQRIATLHDIDIEQQFKIAELKAEALEVIHGAEALNAAIRANNIVELDDPETGESYVIMPKDSFEGQSALDTARIDLVESHIEEIRDTANGWEVRIANTDTIVRHKSIREALDMVRDEIALALTPKTE